MRKYAKVIIAITLALLLYLSSVVYADLVATEGLAIDLTSAGAGLDQTITFDPTEFLGSRTWGDASTDTIVWTWDRATGTDPTITFGNGALSTNSTWTASSFIGNLTGNADTVTTIPNLTGEVTSSGTSTTIIQSFLEDGGASEIAVTAGMMNTGTNASAATFWRGDNTWVGISGGGDMLKSTYDSGNSGGVDVITSVDSTSATDFVLLTDTAVGTDAVKTDGALTYAATTGTLGATEFVGGGVGLTGVVAVHDGTITWTGTSILESGAAFQFGDGTDATLTHTYANTGTNVAIIYSTAAMDVTGALSATLGIDLGTSQALTGTTAMTIGDNGQTVAINSSDWDIDATGIMTGIGSIAADDTIIVAKDITDAQQGTNVASFRATGASDTTEFLHWGYNTESDIGFILAGDAGIGWDRDLVIQINAGNTAFGTTAIDGSAQKVISIGSGTAPAAELTDAVQIYSEDQAGVGGQASFTLMTESGAEASFGTFWRIQGMDDGSIITNGSVLGEIQFYGDDDTASADEIGGQIKVTATEAWTDGTESAKMALNAANNGTLNTDQLLLNPDGSVNLAGDLTIGGDDLFMATNTDTALLVADGTNFNPVVPTGDVLMDNAGAVVIQTDAVDDTMIDFGPGAGQVSAADIPIALGVGSPTIDQVQEYLDQTGSSGYFIGGILSDGGSGTLDITAGEGFIRTTDDENAPIISFKFAGATGLAITDDTTQYIFVNDSGTINQNTDEFTEAFDNILLGVATDEGGTVIHTFNLGVRLEESIGQMGRYIRHVDDVTWNRRKGGLIFGQSGDANRFVTVTTGQLEWGRTSYPISAFDTSGADTFDTYSAGGQEATGVSAWPNTQYDNAGTLTTLSNNNKWAVGWLYVEPDDHEVWLYGREEHGSEAEAQNEEPPNSSIPNRLSAASVLTAKFIFQKSSNTATIQTLLGSPFNSSGVTGHANLSDLAWTSSGHTGTASSFAGFDGGGAASEYTEANYVLADGSRPLTANWDVGAFTITGTQFISDIVTGTAPFVVASTTEVANLLAANASTAALATTVTVSDDESTDDEHEIVFTTDNLNLESDGDISYNPSTGELRVGKIVGDERHWLIPIINPLAAQTETSVIPIWPVTPAALTVTKIVVTLNAAGNEVTGDLKYADARIGLANPVVINDFDTTSGVRTDVTITVGAVPAGKFVYLQFDAAPHTDITDMTTDVTWDFD